MPWSSSVLTGSSTNGSPCSHRPSPLVSVYSSPHTPVAVIGPSHSGLVPHGVIRIFDTPTRSGTGWRSVGEAVGSGDDVDTGVLLAAAVALAGMAVALGGTAVAVDGLVDEGIAVAVDGTDDGLGG